MSIPFLVAEDRNIVTIGFVKLRKKKTSRRILLDININRKNSLALAGPLSQRTC